MSLPDKLSNISGGKDDHHPSNTARRERDKDVEPPDASAAGLVQRCVIIQRDEKGYGFTVTGDNPVFVASVKPDGAASRAGVQNNDRIVKVNGTLVTSRNHLDVVKLIKSGSYVALTLVGKPQTSAPVTSQIANTSIVNTSINRDSMAPTGLVTAPQPVNADKDRELWQQKIHMTKAMHETAIEDYQKLERLFSQNPLEKLHNQLLEKKRTVKALDNQLQQLTGEHPSTPTNLISKTNRYSDSEHGNLEQFAGQSWQSHRRTPSNTIATTTTSSSTTSSSGKQHHYHIKHTKQTSVPALMGRSAGEISPKMRVGSAAVARSKSDAAVRKSKVSSIFYVANQQGCSGGSADFSEAKKRYFRLKRAASLPSATSDISSMSDSPQTSPSISPTPNDAMMAAIRHNGQDTEDSSSNLMMRQEIIHDDDEDMSAEEVQTNVPGPFADIKLLENEPAHMAVLLNYLISNINPSPVLFHIISSAFSRCSASVKELRKWAYEIYSVFIAQGCPLNIGLEENLINQIDSILTTAVTRTDETILRSMFQQARKSINRVVNELLTDFRSKKDLGMANFYGFEKMQDNMDKATAGKVAEEVLLPLLETLAVGPDEISSSVNDKDMATGWALATFLRLNGVGGSSKSSHNLVWDKVPTFMMKDKKGIKFPVSRSGRAKNVKGHQFTNQHFYVTTICNRCGHLVWGVGYQGFQCQSCEMTVHKQCVDDVNEVCGGKKKRKFAVPRKPSTISTTSSTSLISNLSHGSGTTDISSLDGTGSGGPIIQPIPREDDADLASTLLFIAGIPTGHSVKSIVSRYEENSPLEPSSPSPMTTSTTSSGYEVLDIPSSSPSGSVGNGVRNERRSSTDLNRSGSLNDKGEKGDRRTRRAKSDVQVDTETFNAISQSGSSSTSSMSNRSGESPSTSTDNVHEQEELDRDVEPELPSLKQVLGEDVLRKLKPKEKKRQEVINELMYTERAHLRNLRVLDKVFNQPMRNDIEFMQEMAKALFPNLDEMVKLHESITKDFKDRREDNPVITNVGDILLKRFDGENGEVYRKGCAEYCRNQAHTLEALKRQTRKEIKLAQFLTDAESKPVCRRLHLRDLVPSQMQRLTKYPLLIENLLKYTNSSSEEHKYLQRAHERCKHILSYVNMAVKECENYHKLKEIQKKLDKKSLEASNDPAMSEVKNLKLVEKKLILDGPLMWKLKQNRTIDLHVLLLEDMLVLLQKQDDKYVLKYQNANVPSMRDSVRDEYKFTHSPVLKLKNLLVRDVAIDEKSFFLVNMSESRAQMYELTASTKDLREKWGKLISGRAEELKKMETERPAGGRPLSAFPSRQTDRIEVETAKVGRHSLLSDPGHNMEKKERDQIDGYQISGLDADEEDEEEEGGMVQPNQVCVSNVVTAQATAIRTPLELLQHNNDTITAALEERDRLLEQLLELAPRTSQSSSASPLPQPSSTSTLSTTAAVASSSPASSPSSLTSTSLHPTSNPIPSVQTMPESLKEKRPSLDQEGKICIKVEGCKDSRQGVGSEQKKENSNSCGIGDNHGINSDSHGMNNHETGDCDDDNLKIFLMKAVTKVREFIQLVIQAQNESIPTTLQLQQQEYQQKTGADDGSTPPVSPNRRMSGLAQEISSDINSQTDPTKMATGGHQQSPTSSLPSHRPVSVTSKPPPSPDKTKVAMPLDQLKEMMTEMNTIMAKLMSTVNNGKEEKKRLHQELKEARAKLDVLKDMQQQMIISGAVPPDRFADEDDQQQQGSSYLSSPVTPQPPSSPSFSSPPASPLSPLSLSASQQQQPPQFHHHSLQSSIVEEESLEESVAAEDESSSSLSSRLIHQQQQQEVHHGIQEAVILTESVETLDSSPSTQTAMVVGHSHGVDENNDDNIGGNNNNVNNNDDSNSNKVIEIAMDDDDDDDDDDIVNTNVSVADLPLPDMASVPALSSIEGEELVGGIGVGVSMVESSDSVSISENRSGLLDNVDLDEASDEDDSNTVVGKGEGSPDTSHDSVQVSEGGEKKIRVKGVDEEDEEEEYDDAIEI